MDWRTIVYRGGYVIMGAGMLISLIGIVLPVDTLSVGLVCFLLGGTLSTVGAILLGNREHRDE